MARSVVVSVGESIGVLLIEEAKFLYGVEDQVLDLQIELLRMQCFLEDADAIQYKNKRVRNWVAEIRELAYRSETALDTFIYDVASRRRRGSFHNFIRRFACILNECVALHRVGSEIETIKIKITKLTTMLQTYGIRDLTRAEGLSIAHERHQLLRRTYSHVIEEDFVGFQEDISNLVAALVGNQFRAISIYGMGGLGKTSLAKQVYHHEDVRSHFDAFAWACISQQWEKDDVLQGILVNLMPERREEILKMGDQDLVKQLFEIQQKKKCLVVLDDVWSTDVWDIIKFAFPNGNLVSKILLTSRLKDVAEHTDPSGFHHEHQQLDDKESWQLFQNKAFLRGDDTDSTRDQKLKLGREMVKHCGGLPLAIVVLGGLLVRKHTLNEWQTVHHNIDSYLRRDKRHGEQYMGVSEVLALSYHDLPYWLKPCFLYFGNYPEGYEMEAEKLYQLWMAEGIISLEEEDRGEETMMEVAERYLCELEERCMVQVQIENDYSTSSSSRNFKSCRLHDLMRDMCLSMVKEENFLTIADYRHSIEQQHCSSSSFLATSSTHRSKIHRLAVYLNEDLDEDINRYLWFDQEKNIRSALFFFRGECLDVFWKQLVSRLPKDFKLVRVLDLQGFRFSVGRMRALPKPIGNLIHLRYLSLRYAFFNELPSSIGNLKYLETLDLRVDCSLTVPNVLWKLEQLRHLYFPTSYLVMNRKLRLDGLTNLETLHNFEVECCNVKDLPKLTNLRKLMIASIKMEHQEYLMGIISYFMNVTQKRLLLQHSSVCIKGFNFCSKEGPNLLRQILWECYHLHKLYIEGSIRELPGCQQRSHSSLTHLTLSGSGLVEDPLARLEKLPNLLSLSLVNDSFVGKEMVCSSQGFPRLKSLELESLTNLEKWRVDKGTMPSLSVLEIKNCTKLKMVPAGLRFVTALQKLNIFYMPQEFVDRLRVLDGKKGEDFEKVRHVPFVNLVDCEMAAAMYIKAMANTIAEL